MENTDTANANIGAMEAVGEAFDDLPHTDPTDFDTQLDAFLASLEVKTEEVEGQRNEGYFPQSDADIGGERISAN